MRNDKKAIRTVLVVEDEHDTRVTLRKCLEEAGYFVVSAANGASALELLGNMSVPDVILLDIDMPIMSGDQYLDVAKKNPRFAKVPIIQMTAAHNHQRTGTLFAVSKPLDLDKLLQLIERC